MTDDTASPALLAARAAAALHSDAPMSSRMLDGFGLPASDGSIVPAGTPPVRLNVSFTSNEKKIENVSMSVGMDVAQLKEQLFAHSTLPPDMRKLTLHHLDGSVAAELGAETDRALLGSYGPLNGWEVRVHDVQDAAAGATDDAADDTSWVATPAEWSEYPKPPDSKRG